MRADVYDDVGVPPSVGAAWDRDDFRRWLEVRFCGLHRLISRTLVLLISVGDGYAKWKGLEYVKTIVFLDIRVNIQKEDDTFLVRVIRR